MVTAVVKNPSFATKSQEQEYALACAFDSLKHYDAGVSSQEQIRKSQLDANYDATSGLPVGSTQLISPRLIEQEFEGKWFANNIPVEPIQGAGATESVFTRVTHEGSMTYSEIESEESGRLDTGFQNVERRVGRPRGYIRITYQELERLSLAASKGDQLSQVNLLQTKRQTATEAWATERNHVLCYGRPEMGLYGMLSDPDRQTYQLGAAIDENATDPTLLGYLSAIEERFKFPATQETDFAQSYGARSIVEPTTVVMGSKNYTVFDNKRLSDASMSTRQWWIQNKGNRQFDGANGGTRTAPYEFAQTGFLDNAGQFTGESDNHAIIMFPRRLKYVSQVVPMQLTYRQPVQRRYGYEVGVEAEVTGLQQHYPYRVIVALVPTS